MKSEPGTTIDTSPGSDSCHQGDATPRERPDLVVLLRDAQGCLIWWQPLTHADFGGGQRQNRLNESIERIGEPRHRLQDGQLAVANEAMSWWSETDRVAYSRWWRVIAARMEAWSNALPVCSNCHRGI